MNGIPLNKANQTKDTLCGEETFVHYVDLLFSSCHWTDSRFPIRPSHESGFLLWHDFVVPTTPLAHDAFDDGRTPRSQPA